MSFNVTQCPACESTFNTNSRVLAAAAGKVRCGACLKVFEASDHFLIPDQDDAELADGESVFVGNRPEEYFDPSRFLTRSALRESQQETDSDPVAEERLHAKLEQSQTVSEEFFSSLAEELQGREEPAAEPQRLLEKPRQQLLEHKPRVDIDEAFEAEILDSFAAETEALAGIEAKPATESEGADDREQGLTPEPVSPLVPEAEPGIEARTDPEAQRQSAEGEASAAQAPAIEADIEPQEPQQRPAPVGLALSASFSFAQYARPRPAEDEDVRAEGVATDEQASPDSAIENETALEADVEAEAAYTEDIEAQFLSTVADELDQRRQEQAEPDSSEPTDADRHAAAGPQDPAAQASAADRPVATAEYVGTLTPDAAEASMDDLTAKRPADEDVDEAEADPAPAPESEALDESTEAIRARALKAQLDDEEALEAIPKENLAALGAMSSPVEFLSGRESRLLRSSLLLLSIIVLGAALASQVLWQRMERYSQLPQLRAVYEFACARIGCELPEFSDIGAIRSENLTVQTHPDFDKGLMVNTVIRNTAAFAQPFPILILSFNSAANSVIALREFTAAEYLDSGLRAVRDMPSMAPVQISLAILDPGPEAVNYTLAFRLP